MYKANWREKLIELEKLGCHCRDTQNKNLNLGQERENKKIRKGYHEGKSIQSQCYTKESVKRKTSKINSNF